LCAGEYLHGAAAVVAGDVRRISAKRNKNAMNKPTLAFKMVEKNVVSRAQSLCFATIPN
jgi:hypothetical protein